MNRFETLVVVFLAIIAVNMTYTSVVRPAPSATAATASGKSSTEAVVRVVGKFTSNLRGADFTGFVVQGDKGLLVVSYDPGSLFDTMPAPKYLVEKQTANGKKSYMPIELR